MSEIKIALVGGGGIGKSCITIRHVEGKFQDTFYDPTIEDSYVKEENVDGETFFCSILDTAGQEEFYSLRDLYMRQCDGFILVYSITDRKSLDNVTDFVKHLKRVKDCTDIPLVLIGNKSDLESERQISRVQGKNLAELLEIKHFYETSAKTGDNVNEAFEQIIRLTSAHLKQTKKQTTPSPRKKQTKKCCIM